MSASAIEAGRAYVTVSLKNNIDIGISQLQNRLRMLSGQLSEYGRSVAKVGAVIATSFGGALASLSFPVRIAAGIETVSKQFKVLTGSAAIASKQIAELRAFARDTAYGFSELAQGTRTLLSFGVASGSAVADIKRLAEVAGGNADALGRLSLAFGQVAARGRLQAQEVLQFVDAGLNPLQIISEQTGVSMSDLADQMQKGNISFEQVRGAFIAATSAGGRFNGLMDEMAATAEGMFSTLKDNIRNAVAPIGSVLLPQIKSMLRSINDTVTRMGLWIESNKELAFSFLTLAGAGTAVGVGIAGVGVAFLAAAKSIDIFTVLFVDGPKLFRRFTGAVASTGTSASVAASTIKVATTEAFSQVVVTSGMAQKSLGSLGAAFNRIGARAVSSMSAFAGAITGAAPAVVGGVAEIVASLSTLGPLSVAAVDRATAMVTASLARFRAAISATAGSIAGFSASSTPKLSGAATAATAAADYSLLPAPTTTSKPNARPGDLVEYGLAADKPQPQKSNYKKGDKQSFNREVAQALGLMSTSADDLLAAAAQSIDQPAKKATAAAAMVAKTGAKDFAAEMAELTASLAAPKWAERLVGGAEIAKDALTKTAGAAANAGRSVASGLGAAMSRVASMGTGIAAALAPLAIVGIKIVAVVAAVGAVAVAFGYLLNKAGYLGPMIEGIKSTFSSLVGLFNKVSQGVTDAISAGDWAGAVRVAWLGAKVAFYRGLNAIVDAGGLGGILKKIGTFFYDMTNEVISGMVRIVKALPSILYSVITGANDMQSLVAEAFFGGKSSRIKKYAADAEAEFGNELSRLAKQRDDNAKPKSGSSGASGNNVLDQSAFPEMERRLANVNRGVAEIAAGLPTAKIEEANQAASERIKTLQQEIKEAAMGKAAYAQYTMAIEGVTAANRRAVEILEVQKKAVEATNTAKERIKSLQEEILVTRMGADFAERFKLAQQGANQAVLAALSGLQAQKIYLDAMKGLRDQATEAVFGAEAANLLRYAQQGLTKEQVASVASLQNFAKRMADVRSFADQLREKYKTPLDAFNEAASKIRDAQLSGMISQSIAAKAYADAMKEMQSKTDELNQKSREPLKFVNSFGERNAFYKNIEEQMKSIKADQEGRKFASQNATAGLGRISAVSMSTTPQLELMHRQTNYLSDIRELLDNPKEITSLR